LKTGRATGPRSLPCVCPSSHVDVRQRHSYRVQETLTRAWVLSRGWGEAHVDREDDTKLTLRFEIRRLVRASSEAGTAVGAPSRRDGEDGAIER